ncbi:MAG: T9SS type A sorting domain-containing protein [Saprospiraceae bacterium]|nr:T9SS type A sorting domain-containing protein [Saprospiraceae bacterium]
MYKFFSLLFLLTGFNLSGQIIVSPALLGGLPSELKESSGLLIQSPDTLWSHNDSGNGSKVIAFNSFGDKLVERKFDNISDNDWEEITKDDKGHVFLGDFGNNDNTRENLLILRFSSGFASKKQTLVVDSIQFKYEDQTLFPPPSSSLNFDCEAMVVLNDTVFLFTKDRTNPYKSQTLLYWLPAEPGFHEARYLRTFKTEVPLFLQGSITAAALSPDHKKLILLGYLRMWLFTDFTGSNFFDGKQTVFQFEDYTQKESVAFLDDCTIYITDEVNAALSNGGKLYSVDLCSYLSAEEPNPETKPYIAFNNSTNILTVNSEIEFDEIAIFGLEGNLIYKRIPEPNQNYIKLDLDSRIPPGIYVYTLKSGAHFYSGKFLVL